MITEFTISDRVKRELEKLVDKIERTKGDFVSEQNFTQVIEGIDVEAILAAVFDRFGMVLTREDLIGICFLAWGTEIPTLAFSAEFQRIALLHDATWLGRFNEKVWTPDELTHADPFKLLLLRLGVSEAELDRFEKDVREVDFRHVGGETPLHAAVFGMIQEFLTDQWHGLIGDLINFVSKELAFQIYSVKKRETLHRVWYGDMARKMVLDNPREGIKVVSEASALFELPGNQLIPAIQANAERWLPLMGKPIREVIQETIRHLYTMLGDNSHFMGEFAVDFVERKPVHVNPVATWVLNWMRGRDPLHWSHSLLGEALLSKVGLDNLYLRNYKHEKKKPTPLWNTARSTVKLFLPANVGVT